MAFVIAQIWPCLLATFSLGGLVAFPQAVDVDVCRQVRAARLLALRASTDLPKMPDLSPFARRSELPAMPDLSGHALRE